MRRFLPFVLLCACETVEPYDQKGGPRGPSPVPPSQPAPQPQPTPEPVPSLAGVDFGEIEYEAGACPEPSEPWVTLPRSAIVQVVTCTFGGCVVSDGAVYRDPVGPNQDAIRVPCGTPDASYSLRWVSPL